MSVSRGFSLAECSVALVIAGLALAAAIPAAAGLLDGARLAAGTREFVLTLQSMRWKSVARHRAHGLLFQRDGRGWHWFVVEDGNGNGISTAEVESGLDPTLSGPHRLEDVVQGVRPGIPDDRSFPAIPPREGLLDHVDGPVRFGNSDVIAFGALGTSSSGTIYLTDDAGSLAAVSLFGATARIRVWRFDRRREAWAD